MTPEKLFINFRHPKIQEIVLQEIEYRSHLNWGENSVEIIRLSISSLVSSLLHIFSFITSIPLIHMFSMVIMAASILYGCWLAPEVGEEAVFWGVFVMYWVGLGVASSIGLGSGIQSGLLFVMPHIYETCQQAMNCPSLSFDNKSLPFLSYPGSVDTCHQTSSSLSFSSISLFFKVIPAPFLWACGSALGEVPLFLLARSTSYQGQDELIEEELGSNRQEEENGENHKPQYSISSILYSIKRYMIQFLRNNGFMAVLALSSFPNFLFDVVGICCGQSQMDFLTFFIPLLIGKSFIRTSYQTLFSILMFHQVARAQVMALFPTGIQDICSKLLFNATDSSISESGNNSITSWLLFSWKIGSILLFIHFIGTCLKQLAQNRALFVAEEKMKGVMEEGGGGLDLKSCGEKIITTPSSFISPKVLSPSNHNNNITNKEDQDTKYISPSPNPSIPITDDVSPTTVSTPPIVLNSPPSPQTQHKMRSWRILERVQSNSPHTALKRKRSKNLNQDIYAPQEENEEENYHPNCQQDFLYSSCCKKRPNSASNPTISPLFSLYNQPSTQNLIGSLKERSILSPPPSFVMLKRSLMNHTTSLSVDELSFENEEVLQGNSFTPILSPSNHKKDI